MSTLLLALRNLLRNRRRSLATLLTMVVGLTAILLFGGYRSNIQYGTLTGFVQYTGHLQIQRQGYFEEGSDNPAAYGIHNYAALMTALQQDPQLRPLLNEVTPTLQLGGIAGRFAANVSRSVLVNGVDAAARNRMLRWNEYDVVSYAQPLALEGRPADSVVLGQGVARKLRLCGLLPADMPCTPLAATGQQHASSGNTPADIAALAQQDAAPAAPRHDAANRIELLAASQRGAPNVASLQVVKASNMGIKALDDLYMAMHLQQAQALVYGRDTPQVTAILLQLHHTADLDAARTRLHTLLAQHGAGQNLTVLDFRQLNPMYEQTNQFMDSLFGFIAMLIGVIVLFTLGNTMSSAVVERTSEIGTLRALGLRRAGIRRLFLCEALLLGLAGVVLGVLAALAVAALINHSGWRWTPPGYAYAYLILVRVGQDIPLLLGSVGGMLGVTLLSAWWPARRAARQQIVDALRHS
jgi:putative ABC transport system permease protein